MKLRDEIEEFIKEYGIVQEDTVGDDDFEESEEFEINKERD